MKNFRIFLFLGILLITISVTAQGPEPTHNGELTVPGLNDTVEILRDEWGVPHIYASNTYDLVFAQGYTMAQDRWWQMEFSRHTASGRIQELTGRNESLMGTDRYLRSLGFREIAEQELANNYNDESRMVLQAFADGVNAYIIGKEPAELAFEYNALRLTGVTPDIEPWTPIDSIIWGKVMAQDLGGNAGFELFLSQLYATLDEELLAFYDIPYPFDEKPTIFLEEDLPLSQAPLSLAGIEREVAEEVGIVGVDDDGFQLADIASPFGSGIGIGSNNWVAHGAITESGLPLMANDMHLGIQMPSIWYEIGLHCVPVGPDCPFNVVGFAFSSTPLITAGHNNYIAWAHTNVGPDVQDYYMIRVNPDNPLQYEWDGEWRDMTTREETLNFGGTDESVTFTVRMTHLGPIMNDRIDGFNNDDPRALRWTALEPGTLFQAQILLNRATNWDEFREALSYWDVPSQNIVYADTEGNIGYQMPGNIPIRAAGHTGKLPVPGWTSEYEWLGYMPYDLLPRIFNPERGYIATANQAAVPPAYYDEVVAELADEFGADADYQIHTQFAYGYRGDRINSMLEDLAPHTAETFVQIHGDNFDGSAAELMPFFADLEITDEDLAATRDWLTEWDYQMHKDSGQAALWANTWVALVDNLFQDNLGNIRARGGGNEWWAAYLLAQDPDNIWWDDVNTADVVETRDDILLRSLQDGHAATVEALGDDLDTWAWGTLHTTTFVSNPLGVSGVAPIENTVNRGPVATSGTSNAVNATGWSGGSGNFAVRSGPSERVIYDVSDWGQSLSMHTTGQSGHPGSVNYDSMIAPWVNIEYRTMLWTREQVEAAAVNTLTLQPE